jgi:cytochrome P450
MSKSLSESQTLAAEPPARPDFPAFDPLAPDQRGDPYPVLFLARQEQPVFWMPAQQTWCVTRHADALAVLSDPETYSSRNMGGRQADPPPGFRDRLPDGYPTRVNFAGMDPPEHTRMRRLVQPAFTPKVLRQYEPIFASVAERLLDEAAAHGELDLIREFGGAYAGTSIAGMFGLAIDDYERYERWIAASLAVGFPPPAGYDEPESETLRRAETLVEVDEYLSDLITAGRSSAGQDFLSTMMRAGDGEPSLTDAEIKGTLCLLLLAGTHTTSNLIANMTLTLLADRPRWDAVREHPETIPAVVEESLRLRGPSRGVYRQTTRDVELGGQRIPAGEAIYVSLASANRDEAVFREPAAFDPGRPNLSSHIAFSRRVHFCLGAPLARILAAIALRLFVSRFPDMEVIGGQRFEWTANALQPKLLSARVRLR